MDIRNRSDTESVYAQPSSKCSQEKADPFSVKNVVEKILTSGPFLSGLLHH